MNEANGCVPRIRIKINLSPADEERFWSKVNKTGPTQPHMATPCWVWAAGKSKKGYGAFSIGGKQIKPHRIVCVLTYGPIPQSLCVCHHCDNPECCRVEHLFLGTDADNARDKITKGRCNSPRGDAHFSRKHPEWLSRGEAHYSQQYPERISRGEAHSIIMQKVAPRGESHWRAKLTVEQVIEIRAIHKTGGVTQIQIAKKFGVCTTAICKIIGRKKWAHIPSVESR